MPSVPLYQGKKCVGTITFADNYEPGDQPPAGDLDWHEWAAVQEKAGLKQERCCLCLLYRYPQEIAITTEVDVTTFRTARDAQRNANPVRRYVHVHTCNDCAAKANDVSEQAKGD